MGIIKTGLFIEISIMGIKKTGPIEWNHGDLFLIIDREDGVVIAMTIVLRREIMSPMIL